MADEPRQQPTPSARYRTLSGPALIAENVVFFTLVILGVLWVLEIYFYFKLTPMINQYIGSFMGLTLGGVFLTIPARKGQPVDKVPWYDWIMFACSLCVGFYVAIFYPSIQYSVNLETPTRVVLGGITILLTLEALRRVIGWVMVGLTCFFLLYAPLAGYFPGILEGRGIPLGQLFNYLYVDSNAILGIPITVASTIILAFVLFGHGLSVTGGSQFFMDLSTALMGRYRGGPAKMAVAASSLFGTISGAAVANVVTTGVITIPMMKRTGFKPKVAAAIEAAASTGGQLMPPVMGASAFLIAELLAVPYRDVVIAAIIPAVLYYFTIFIQIDLEAAKFNIKGLSSSELPDVKMVLKTSWADIIPLLILIVTLFFLNYRPAKAGIISAFAVLLISLLKKHNRLNWQKIHKMVINTGRGALEISAICCAAGIVIGVLNISGLGFGLSLQLVKSLGHNLFLLLVLSAIVCIILGMGMPTVAVYILLAVLVAPALTDLGIVPMAAHLFIFYFGMMCMITPPVCLASFAAAAIADAPPMKTGFTSMRLAVVALVIPFLFVLEPSLIMIGSPLRILLAIITAAIGCYFIGVGLSGFLFTPLSTRNRFFALLGGVGMLIPAGIGHNVGIISDIAGLVIVVLVFSVEFVKKKKSAAYGGGEHAY